MRKPARNRRGCAFRTGSPKPLHARITFRSIGEADAKGGPFAGFAALFNEQISLFDAFAGQLKEELVWRPGYRNITEIVSLNHFLSIDPVSISNDKVMLLNTQRDGDRWEAAFATDEKQTQQFSFDLVYNDGRVKLRKTVSAEVVVKEPGTIPPVMNGYSTGQFNQATIFWGFPPEGLRAE